MKKMFCTFLLLTQYLIGFPLFAVNFSDGNFTSPSKLDGRCRAGRNNQKHPNQ